MAKANTSNPTPTTAGEQPGGAIDKPVNGSSSEASESIERAWAYRSGLTLRQQFAIHAPPMPDWFTATMPPRPDWSLPESWAGTFMVELWAKMTRGQIDTYDGPDEDAPIVVVSAQPVKVTSLISTALLAAAAQKTAAERAGGEWDKEKERQRLPQWPWWYADQAIAAEKANPPKRSR